MRTGWVRDRWVGALGSVWRPKSRIEFGYPNGSAGDLADLGAL